MIIALDPTKTPPSRVHRAFFIDSENGLFSLIEGLEYLTDLDKLFVFHRENVAQELRLKIELCPAQIDWILCVDPKIKNSMDVQIIAELSAQLEANTFDSGFIVSNDKGYLPALHYLKQTSRGNNHVIELIPSIEREVAKGAFRMIDSLRSARSSNELKESLALTLGNTAAESTYANLEKVCTAENTKRTHPIRHRLNSLAANYLTVP